VAAGIEAVVALLSVTRHAPLIDVTNVRAARPLVPVVCAIGRLTHAVMPVQFAAVNVVAPEAIEAVFVIVRAAPLWYTATSKSWIVKADATIELPVLASNTQAIRKLLWDAGWGG